MRDRRCEGTWEGIEVVIGLRVSGVAARHEYQASLSGRRVGGPKLPLWLWNAALARRSSLSLKPLLYPASKELLYTALSRSTRANCSHIAHIASHALHVSVAIAAPSLPRLSAICSLGVSGWLQPTSRVDPAKQQRGRHHRPPTATVTALAPTTATTHSDGQAILLATSPMPPT